MSLSWCLVLPVFVVVRSRGLPRATARQAVSGLGGGLASILAYGIVIWAMQHDAMGAVSALRETSVVFAAVIGWLLLGEPLTTRRLTSCCAITLGAACLALSG
jgi:drug/metabolite transporter (DMT)-like permease